MNLYELLSKGIKYCQTIFLIIIFFICKFSIQILLNLRLNESDEKFYYWKDIQLKKSLSHFSENFPQNLYMLHFLMMSQNVQNIWEDDSVWNFWFRKRISCKYNFGFYYISQIQKKPKSFDLPVVWIILKLIMSTGGEVGPNLLIKLSGQ